MQTNGLIGGRRAFCVLGVVLCLLAGGGPASAAEPVVFQLENKLEVLLKPLPGARHVAVVTLFDIGNANDPEGQSGLAHMVEHMLATCAAGRFPMRTTEKLMQSYPLGWNAQTGTNYTVIAFVAPKDKLSDELEHAAARMGDLKITEADLAREKPRMVDELENMFGGMLHLGALNQAREGVLPSPEGARRGGVPEQVDKFTVEQLQSFWRKHYKAGNARLVVAGDFEPTALRKEIETRFGDCPSGEAPPRPRDPGGMRIGILRREATPKVPGPPAFLAIRYAAPAPDSEDYAPYVMLVTRLINKLIPRGMQPQGPPPVWFTPLDDPWSLALAQELAKPEDGEQAIEAFHEHITAAAKEEVTAADLGHVRMTLGFLLGLGNFTDAQLAMMSPYGLAFGLGRRWQLGMDPTKLEKALGEVKTEDLARVVKTWFGKGRRTAVILSAKKSGAPSGSPFGFGGDK